MWRTSGGWRETLGVTPVFALFILALIGLPIMLVYTVRAQMQMESLANARAISEIMLQVRRYYNLNVVNRIAQAPGEVVVTENYHDVKGAIPIPATMSIEIAQTLTEKIPNSPFDFSFTSDHPFKGRNRPALDGFQKEALAAFRRDPQREEYWREDRSAAGGEMLRLALPVKMQPVCVACHNSHPESTYRLWQVGDVRGIQDVAVRHQVSEGRLENLAWLGAYLLFFMGTLLAALHEYRRGNATLRRLNEEQARNRQQLELQGQQLRGQVNDLLVKTTVLDKAPFGVLIADPHQPDLPVVYANEAFSAITGYGAHEVIGRNCRFLQGPQTDPQSLAVIRRALSQKITADVELANYRRDGRRFCNRLMLFPCFNRDNELISWVGCLYDVTDFKLATDEKNRLAAELQESLKLESLGLTIAGIAHDLNTPIGIALTASSHLGKTIQQMQRQAAQGAAPAETVARWTSSLERASQLVQSNLGKAADLVRSFKQTTADATRVEWRRLPLKGFLESLLVSVSPLMRRAQCEVTLACQESLVLYTEPGSLSQVITNLVVNASVHAFEGRVDRRIDISVVTRGDRVVIEVADNGNGMAQEAVAKAFTPFFTTRRSTGGSGLGLFSARRVVENTLGGKLTFRTEQGQGTVFTIDLPAAAAGPAAQ
ncbi:ATP-binding protein [Macromonas nakdongensis]|uniref:ATP-binding protein n=1 Tax=Macromonas nakdongensis TaxID=1843082 RepID=UPI0012FEE909|nr:ATP-binding protein [Macromonas nakdongensis]